jgi:XTP/dITP diphosphohydrolase
MGHRRLAPGRLVIATHNPGKVREIAALVEPHGIEPVAAGALGLPEPPEEGATFIANALTKAMAAAGASGLPALADDSGLVVDALGGAPGVHSADWAEAPDGPKGSKAGGRDFARAMERVRREWLAAGAGAPDTARFVCALALAWPDGHVETFEGVVEGRLVWPPRGTLGFGYDPMFVAEGQTLTFGELDPAAKHAISHRADAFRQLAAACLG